jgi:tripartite-type tricarboxylate transporter receptor subunit TctC
MADNIRLCWRGLRLNHGRIMWHFRHDRAPVWRRRTRGSKVSAMMFFAGGIKTMRSLIGAVLLGLTMLQALTTNAFAQAYPTKPVSLLIAFPPGGPSDVLSRVVGKKLEQILGQPFIMDNRPGAGGNIAAEAAAIAAADGHTILMGNNSILATNAALYKKVNFDPEKDFAPISLIGSQANILVVNPNVPVQSLAELIALLRANPGKFNYASSGHGTAAHLAAELFKAEAKVEITHVPYKGGAPALTDVIAGHVHMIFATAASVVPHIKSGKVRALAVTPITRTAVFPELATIDELGLKGFDATTWHGLVAPAKTPREIVVRLHRATVEALQDAQVRKSLTDLGVDIVGNSPEEFSAYIKAEIPKWTAIVKASGAKLD